MAHSGFSPQGGQSHGFGKTPAAGASRLANQGANFVPQGAQQVEVKGLGPQLGKTVPVGVAQPIATTAPTQVSSAAALKARPPSQKLAGPFFGDRMSGRSENEVHSVSIKALGSDGREYVAKFDAVFPRGSKILGVSEQVVE